MGYFWRQLPIQTQKERNKAEANQQGETRHDLMKGEWSSIRCGDVCSRHPTTGRYLELPAQGVSIDGKPANLPKKQAKSMS